MNGKAPDSGAFRFQLRNSSLSRNRQAKQQLPASAPSDNVEEEARAQRSWGTSTPRLFVVPVTTTSLATFWAVADAQERVAGTPMYRADG